MKKSKKILSLLASVTATSATIAPVITACSHELDPIVSTLKEETVRQFIELAPIPRYSDRYNYKDIGVEEQQTTLLNKIKAHYKQIVEKQGLVWNDQGATVNDKDGNFICEGNCYFDIPASDDGKNIPTIILQGHMDMVFARAEESDRGLDTPIEIVQRQKDGKQIIESEDNQSSIGADDGIGIASMLSVLVNRNKFTHGKIRCLLTTDEEPGLIGAEQVPEEWFFEDPADESKGKIQYLLNIDGEEVNSSDIANNGGSNYELSCSFTSSHKFTPTSYTFYKFEAKEFYGGHSSLADIHTSPLKYLTKIVGEIKDENENFVINNVATSGAAVGNAIPTGASVMFGITDTEDKTIEYKTKLDEALKKLKGEFPEEEEAEVNVTKIETAPTTSLTKEVSVKILNLLNELSCGVVSPKTNINYYAISNIAPVNMSLEDNKFSLCIYPRSYNVDLLHLIDTNIEAKYEQYLKSIDTNAKITQVAYYEPWVPEADNPMKIILRDGFKSANINDPIMEYCPGGLECSWWFKKQPEINIGVIGPTVTDPHSIYETIYLDTLDSMLQVLVHTLRNIKVIEK